MLHLERVENGWRFSHPDLNEPITLTDEQSRWLRTTLNAADCAASPATETIASGIANISRRGCDHLEVGMCRACGSSLVGA